MRLARTSVVTLLALLALGGTANAYINTPVLPEYGRCLKVTAPTGAYKTGVCTTLGLPKAHEWFPAFGTSPLVKAGFTLASTGSVYLEGKVSHDRLTCAAATGAGSYTSNTTTGKIVLTLTGCEIKALGFKCENKGPGVIETNALAGELGVIKAEPPLVHAQIGERLAPETGGQPLAEFTCAGGGVLVKVTGAVFVKRSTNAMQTIATLSYAQVAGTQKYVEFEGGTPEQLSLNAGTPELAGLHAVIKQTNEEKVEIHCPVEGC